MHFMSQLDVWQTEPDGGFAAEGMGMRLTVHGPEKFGGVARFLVLRRDGSGSFHRIVGSGSEEDVRGAMDAAIRMAKHILAPL
jgi:hypothetical protein